RPAAPAAVRPAPAAPGAAARSEAAEPSSSPPRTRPAPAPPAARPAKPESSWSASGRTLDARAAVTPTRERHDPRYNEDMYRVETEQEEDGRWIAEVPDL